MFAWTYSAALTILSAVYTPKLLYDLAVKKKYRLSLLQRLGIKCPPLPRQPVIWLHAVSMGETHAMAPLAQLLAHHHPDYPLVVSSVTETGHAEARRLIPQASAHVFLPIDWKYTIHSLLKNTPIHLLILSEGDLWWRFMDMCRQRGATIALINGKMSERSLSRLLWCTPLRQRLSSLLDICCVQNSTYAERFKYLGVTTEKIHVTGNLKFDVGLPSGDIAWLQKKLNLAFYKGPMLVIGSTHEGEEKLAIEALSSLWHKYPHLRIIIAPRHPERFEAVAALLSLYCPSFGRWSQGCQKDWRLLLFDTMGLLSQLYILADIAIVGGSLIPGIGGHNIIEPCLAGAPVIFGPFMDKQPEMVAAVQIHQTGLQLKQATDLASTVQTWLADTSLLNTFKEHCRTFRADTQGASAQTYRYLSPILLARNMPS